MQRRATEAQSSRDDYGNAKCSQGRAGRWLRHNCLGTVRRNRGRHDRSFGRRLEYRAAKGWVIRTLRTNGEVERGFADRRRARRGLEVRRICGLACKDYV